MRTRHAVASVLLIGLCTACGSTPASEPDTAQETLSEAVERTFDEASGRVSMVARQGDYPPTPGEKLSGEVSFEQRAGRAHASGTEYIFTPTHWYLNDGLSLTGKKWTRFARDQFAVDIDDRLRLIAYLAAGATAINDGRPDQLGDTSVMRYETTVRVESALQAVPQRDRELAKAVLEDQLLGPRGQATFWIDGDGRLLRIRVRVPRGRSYTRKEPDGDSVSFSSEDLPLTSTIDFENFGVAVDAQPPPDDQVGELGDLDP